MFAPIAWRVIQLASIENEGPETVADNGVTSPELPEIVSDREIVADIAAAIAVRPNDDPEIGRDAIGANPSIA